MRWWIFLGGLLIGAGIGWHFTADSYQKDAVAHGAGTWVWYEEQGRTFRVFQWRGR